MRNFLQTAAERAAAASSPEKDRRYFCNSWSDIRSYCNSASLPCAWETRMRQLLLCCECRSAEAAAVCAVSRLGAAGCSRRAQPHSIQQIDLEFPSTANLSREYQY